MKKTLFFVLFIALCVPASLPPTAHAQGQGRIFKRAHAIPGRYIVTLKDEAAGPQSKAEEIARDLVGRFGGRLRQVFKTRSTASQLN